MNNKTAGHTPGPWHINNSAIEAHFSSLESGSKVVELVASVYSGDDAPPTGSPEANARLIAAAPELLESVKEFMTHVYPDRVESLKYTKAIALMRAAIAKAEGR